MANNRNAIMCPRVYLMGRLYNKDGKPIGKLFPLPFETLRLVGAQWQEQHCVEASCHKVQKTSLVHPLVYSDKHGELCFFNTQIDSQKDKRTSTGAPYSPHEVNQQALFFPPYLVPMYIEGYQGEWLEKLDSQLVKLESTSEFIFSNKVMKVDLAANTNAMFTLPTGAEERNAIISRSEYFANYQAWLDNQAKDTLHILEVPQYYTIVVAFSSNRFEGATVTLMDAPKELRIFGSEDERKSKVSLVQYQDSSDEQQFVAAATFWIESDAILTLQDIDQYCRVDVDVTNIEDVDIVRGFEQKGVEQYSLTERVFHLPIKTAAGRSTLVNGDPISVEEALINHAPTYYQHLVAQLEKQPNALPTQSTDSSSQFASNIPEQAWHAIQTHKGAFEAAFGSLDKGISWTTISKVVSASVSVAMDGKFSKLAESTAAAAGVTGAAVGFIKTVAELKDAGFNNSIVNKANSVNSILSKSLLAGQSVSPHAAYSRSILAKSMNSTFKEPLTFKPFMAGVGKVGSWLLDKPLIMADALYGVSNAYSSVEASERADKKLLTNTAGYSRAVISVSAQQLTRLEEQGRELIANETAAVEALREQLGKMVVSDLSGDHGSNSIQINNTVLRLDATTFAFDRAAVNLKNILVEQSFNNIAAEIVKLKDPIEITIMGHTCNIGTDGYNQALSVERALAVKECILNQIGLLDQAAKPVWASHIRAVGYGESQPLVDNDSEHNRVKNRRVEILLNFSAKFEYPPCRSAIIGVEKQRKQAIAKAMEMDKSVISALNSSLDMTLCGLAIFFPPVALLAAAKEGTQLANKVYDEATKLLERDKYDLDKRLLTLQHKDIVTSQMYFDDVSINAHQNVLMKSYLKRSLALNGLLRLIQTYQFRKYVRTNTVPMPAEAYHYAFQAGGTTAAMYSEDRLQQERATIQSFDDLDLENYIKTYLLDDSWELEESLLGSIHLDEVWLQQKGFNYHNTSSLATYLAQGRKAWSVATLDDASRTAAEQAKRHNKYFPIHQIASDSMETFKSLTCPELPKHLDPSVFKHVIVSVRAPNAGMDKPEGEGVNDWVPFEEYYQNNGNQLSPYDNVRVLVVLDNQKAQVDLSKANFFPVTLDVMYSSSNEAWQFIDKKATETTEYATELLDSQLMPFERNRIGGFLSDMLVGAIIQPSYFYGLFQIMGIRPVADYDDSVLESLFARNKEKQTSGAAKWLSYYLQVRVPTSRKAEKQVMRFNLTLSPTREYAFTKDFKTYSPKQKGDRLFYEKNFLSLNSPEVKCQYPTVFDCSKVDFYLGQQGLEQKTYSRMNIGDDDIEATKRDPLKKSDLRVRGDIEGFDWNEDVTATIVVRTKYHEPKLLSNGYYDENCIPLANVTLCSNRKDLNLADIHCVYRLGKIEVSSEKTKFINTEYENKELKSEVLELQEEFSKLSSAELFELAVQDGVLIENSISTDVFANVVNLSYLNLFGTAVSGLRPLYKPDAFIKGGKVNVKVSAPVGAGLDGVESNRLKMEYTRRSYARRWYQPESDEAVEFAKCRLRTNRRLQNVDEKASNEAKAYKEMNIQPHHVDVYMEWLKFNDSAFYSLINPRQAMLDDWIDG